MLWWCVGQSRAGELEGCRGKEAVGEGAELQSIHHGTACVLPL